MGRPAVRASLEQVPLCRWIHLRDIWTRHAGQAAGHPATFLVVIFYAVLWLTFGRTTFDWNAIAALAVFVMTLFIQRANRRDSLAHHAKLDELLRDGSFRARSVDEQEPDCAPS